MPSADDLKSFTRLQQGAQMDATLCLVKPPNPLPEDVRKRFPSLVKWEQRELERHKQLLQALANIKVSNSNSSTA